MSNVGEKIKAVRLKKGFTQSMLAEATGILVGNISRLECGWRDPTHKTLERIATALGISVSKLIK